MKKQISALLMCGALSLSMVVPVLAADNSVSISGADRDSDTIKVTISGDSGDSFQGAITVNDKPVVLVDQNFDDSGKITIDVKLDEKLKGEDRVNVGGFAGSSDTPTTGEEIVPTPTPTAKPTASPKPTDSPKPTPEPVPDDRPYYPPASDSSGGSSGGSGGTVKGGTINYPASFPHGAIKTTVNSAKEGEKIIIVVYPNVGYKLDKLTVTDARGNTVELTSEGGDRYSFIMPSTAVTISASFVVGSGQSGIVTGSLPYTDVKSGDWFINAVEYMYRNGIMTGTSATTFSPAQTVDRATIVTMLYRMEGSPAVGTASFPDVAAGQWYSNAAAWARECGVVTGYENGTFGPRNTITRQDLAVILYRYAQMKGYGTGNTAGLSGYTDANQIGSYALEAMRWANATGLITGTTATTLNPLGGASRAEVATIFMRFCMNVVR